MTKYDSPRTYKMACFSCDGTVEEAERYISISRLQKRKDRAGEDEIIEAWASLQICRNCAIIAESGPIPLSEVPIRLLNLEEQGFYWFVRHQTGQREPWKYFVSENNCSICGSEIAPDQHYFLVEIAEEQTGKDGSVEQFERANLATVCGSCSFDLLLDLSLPRM